LWTFGNNKLNKHGRHILFSVKSFRTSEKCKYNMLLCYSVTPQTEKNIH
jgi:hypothetical protein